MHPDQITHVRASFAEVRRLADTAADLFYSRLFALEPGLRALFPEDLRAQKQKLLATLAFAVGALDQPAALWPAVRALGRRHAGYGVSAAHYATVGAALLWTLEAGLGEAFTPEVKAAWAAAYTLLAGAMQAAAEAAELELAPALAA